MSELSNGIKKLTLKFHETIPLNVKLNLIFIIWLRIPYGKLNCFKIGNSARLYKIDISERVPQSFLRYYSSKKHTFFISLFFDD
jgi:hypothetical protein